MTRNIDAYAADYLADYGFEVEMVHYRRKLLLERLAHFQPKRVLEIGCGSEMLAEVYQAQGGKWDAWTVVEPSDEFVSCARKADLPAFQIHQGFFEDVHQVRENEYDLILCSGLLHEVPSSVELIKAIVAAMSTDTILHANVPNANSFHRRLAVAMGFITSTDEMSDRNVTLSQNRVYDQAMLDRELQEAGLKIEERGGHLIKPFTHNQMQAVSETVDRAVLDGLYVMGKENPNWASEIYVEARLR